MDLIARRAEISAGRPAVVSEHETLSYSELGERSNRLAHHLNALGVSNESPVGVCLSRGSDAVVAILGVLKSGGVCVPLDPGYPADRLQFILQDTKASLLITEHDLENRFEGCDTRRAVLDWSSPGLADASAELPRVAIENCDLAYILYTSGSTGMPKGVEIEHQALYDVALKTAKLLELTEDDALFQYASLSFASSLGQVLAPLVAGARVVLKGRHYTATQLVSYISRTGVSVLWLTPSTIRYLTQDERASIGHLGPPLRLLRSGGESLSRSLLETWFAQSSVPLLNCYGPTEGVQDITACVITETPEVISIGKPIFQAEVFILDESENPVEPGGVGQLFFGTPGMARGYLGRPELTERSFVWREVGGRQKRLYRSGDLARELPDGSFEFIGRRDAQFKFRGYRVEPAEIESRLTQHPDVTAAVVALSGEESGQDELVAFFVARDGKTLDFKTLWRWCAQKIPMQIMPTKYIHVNKIPLTVNGKVDKAALVQVFKSFKDDSFRRRESHVTVRDSDNQ
ncbi:amino acid adenylation domain-containing protein [Amycolatopsis sp. NPDC051102]|uniref:amino acid adenylation domain-containing protein n=1 Tax=Amycolatopsis sp. NPDC051102 TaxID=3155163 RepID=UPI0034291D1C